MWFGSHLLPLSIPPILRFADGDDGGDDDATSRCYRYVSASAEAETRP